MFRKPPSKKSLQSALEVASLQKLVVNLDDPSAEALSGGQLTFTSGPLSRPQTRPQITSAPSQVWYLD
jgi:hypothetical protein